MPRSTGQLSFFPLPSLVAISTRLQWKPSPWGVNGNSCMRGEKKRWPRMGAAYRSPQPTNGEQIQPALGSIPVLEITRTMSTCVAFTFCSSCYFWSCHFLTKAPLQTCDLSVSMLLLHPPWLWEKKLFRSFLFACSNAQTNYLVLQKHHCKLKVLNELRVHPSNKSTTAAALLGKRPSLTKAPLQT